MTTLTRPASIMIGLALVLTLAACSPASTVDSSRGAKVSGDIVEVGGPAPAPGTRDTPRPVTAVAAFYRKVVDGKGTGKAVAKVNAPHGHFAATIPAGSFYVLAESDDGTAMSWPKHIRLVKGSNKPLTLRIDVP